MDKIWLVTRETSVDGEIYFYVGPCATKEKAQEVFAETKNDVFSTGHFADLTEEDIKEYCDIEENPNGDCPYFSIIDNTDSYYDVIKMYEEEIIE